MATVPGVGGSSSSGSNSGVSGNDFQNVDLDAFLKLMITELQNQDPLDPVSNSEFLQQITQIRNIGATDKLSNTLAAISTGQSLTTASGLIGKTVKALSDGGENIEGIVDRASVEVDDDDNSKRVFRVHIGGESVNLDNVREVIST